MGAKKKTFRLKRYLSNHTCIFGILKHASCLSRRVTSTAVFSPEAKYKVSGQQWQTVGIGKVGCLRNPFEKLTFPKAIFSAVTLKCLRIRALKLKGVYRVYSTQPEPEFLNIYWRLKSRLFEESCLFKGQSVQQGSQWLQFLCVVF